MQPSLPARALLALGRRIKPHPSGLFVEEPESFDERFRNFFAFFPPERHPLLGLRVAEIGGGYGELCAYLAQRGASHVACIEPNPEHAHRAARTCAQWGSVEVLQRRGEDTGVASDDCDVVILHDVIEHCADPVAVLREARRIVKPSGSILISFMPWGAAYGAHTWSTLPVPWAHLFYPKSVLAEMRSALQGFHTRDLGKTGMYKVTVAGFHRMVQDAGLTVASIEYRGVKQQHWMAHVPLLREVGTAVLGARLVKA
jgi:SAM-dependent methyltransferase